MTTSRLFPATNGPSAPVSYSGAIRTGVLFKVTQGGMWFTGYWKWVATGEDVTARTFALWAVTGAGAGVLIPAATVTSGTLAAGQWNFVPLATPVPLAIGTAYNACTGWTAASGHGFSDSDTTGAGTGAGDSYGTGGHTTGITQGPLTAFSDSSGGGTKGEPYGCAQGTFDTSSSAVTSSAPWTGSNSANFWMDVQVSDTAPGGYSGSYRLYPNKADANSATVPDLAVDYVIATEFTLSQACTLKLWYYSPAGTVQLATSATIWQATSASTGTQVANVNGPPWSGAAGSGWVSCSFPGVILPAGTYKASVYNSAATPDGWSAKDASTNYWGTGAGGGGITNGPLSAPGLSAASLAYEFNGNAGGVPPYSNGVTERGQCTFAQTGSNTYPYLYVDGLAQNYWVDVEATPVVAVTWTLAGTAASAGSAAGALAWQATAAGSAASSPATAGALAWVASLSGGAASTPAASGGLAATAALSGTASLPPAASGSLAQAAALSGTAASAPVAAGALGWQAAVAGTAASVTATSGALPVLQLSGAAASVPSAAAGLAQAMALSGTAAGVTATSGALPFPGISGAAPSGTASSGALAWTAVLAGAAALGAAASGSLAWLAPVSGTAAATPAAAGALADGTTSWPLTGTAATAGTAAGALSWAAVITGTAVTVTGAAATLAIRMVITGTAASITITSGSAAVTFLVITAGRIVPQVIAGIIIAKVTAGTVDA